MTPKNELLWYEQILTVSRDHFYLTIFKIANVTESEFSRAAGRCCVACWLMVGRGATVSGDGGEKSSLMWSCSCCGRVSFHLPYFLTVAAFSWWCICDATHHLVSWRVHWAPLAGAKVGSNRIMKCILVTAYLCQDALYNMNHAPDPPYVTYCQCVLSTDYVTWTHNGETVYAFFHVSSPIWMVGFELISLGVFVKCCQWCLVFSYLPFVSAWNWNRILDLY